MRSTRIPLEIEQQATYWYIRIQSPDITPKQESEFFAWLESSPLHQVAFLRMEQAWTAAGALQLTPAKKAMAPNWSLSFWSASVALILVAVLLVYLSPLHEEKADPEIKEYIASVEQKTITLPDQSSVVLSPNTKMEVRFSESFRDIYLHKGQIFLNVTKDARRAFRVTTNHGSVRVIGTQFAVQQLAMDLKITVVEGLVGLLKPESAIPDETPMLVLHKNQQILYSDALKGTMASNIDADRETSWAKGRMVFDGAPLTEVTAKLNQHLSVPIKIASPELNNKRIVGAISVKNPVAAAASLASIAGAVVEESPNKDALVLKSPAD